MNQRRTYRRLNNPRTNSRPHGMKETSEAMCYLEDLRSEFPRMEFKNIVELARERHGVTIPFMTLYRWWRRFLETGFFPYEHYEMENKKKKHTITKYIEL